MTQAEDPLYNKWRKRKKEMAPVWQNDFFAYRDWLVAKGYEKGDIIMRYREDEPISPENAWLNKKKAPVEKVRKKTRLSISLDDYHPEPGWSHRPCLECGIAEKCTEVCELYKKHYTISMQAYYAAAASGRLLPRKGRGKQK